MYGEALEQDLLFRRNLEEAFATQDFDGCRVLLDSWKPKALSRKKDDSVQEDKRELAKNLRDQAKDAVKKLQENYFYETTEEVLEELELCKEPVQELIRLTRQFIETFSEKKRQKNIVDFTDMEHFALEILVKKEGGEIRYTQAADEFSDRFEEILIDEYQDSNLVQETLLQSVSQLPPCQTGTFYGKIRNLQSGRQCMSEDRPTQKLPKQRRGARRGQSDLLPDHGKGSGSGGIRCRCGIVSGCGI